MFWMHVYNLYVYNYWSYHLEKISLRFFFVVAVYGFLVEQNLISLIRSHLSIFAFIVWPWETDLKNITKIYVREYFA